MPVRAPELTATQVAKLAREKKPGRYAVGIVPGLYLRIEGNSVAWVLRSKVGKEGRRVEVGLGPYLASRASEPIVGQTEPHEKTLEEAREWARRKRSPIRAGSDPVEAKREAAAARAAERRAAKKAAVTFGECAEVVIKQKTADLKNAKHKAQWRSTLETYCKPLWARSVAEVGKQDIAEVLRPIWQSKHETADRLRGRIEAVMDYARGMDYRTGDNPAEWRGTLEPLLGAYHPEVKPQPSLSHRQIGEFMAEVRSRTSMSARALEFMILTTTRTGETIGAKWGEIDLEAREWTIPASRMKAKKEHVVPLSDAAVALLEALPRIVGNDHVFPGSKGSLSNMALTQLVRGMNEKTPRYVDWKTKEPVVPHGFRSTFRDWAGEDTTHEREVIEHALAHRLKDKAEASYWRRTALPKRVTLMQEWADYCAKASPKVATLERAA